MPNPVTYSPVGAQTTTTQAGYTNFSGVLVNQAVIKTTNYGPVVYAPATVLTGNSSAIVHASGFTSVHL